MQVLRPVGDTSWPSRVAAILPANTLGLTPQLREEHNKIARLFLDYASSASYTKERNQGIGGVLQFHFGNWDENSKSS